VAGLAVALERRIEVGVARPVGVAAVAPSGGLGTSQLPSVAVRREMRRKAPRQPGSRQELDIIEPFHSSKMRVWQLSQTPGLFAPFQSAS
jgi:hypothetical protein